MTVEFSQDHTNVISIAKQVRHLYTDKDRIMETMGGSNHFTALSYSWGQGVERHPLWLSTISDKLDRPMRKRLDSDYSKMIVKDHEPDRMGTY